MAKTVTITTAERTRDRVHRSLPTGDAWATTAAVAEACEVPRPTALRALQELEGSGLAERTSRARQVAWRRWGPTPPRRGKDDPPTLLALTLPRSATFPPAKGGRLKARRVAPEPATAPEPDDMVGEVPAEPPAAATGELADVAGWMETVRPVSAPPAEEPRRARARRDPDAPRHVYATWQRGELQDAILTYLRDDTDPDGGVGLTPNQVASGLNSHVGAVAYGLDRLAAKGSAVQTSTAPKRYAAV